MNTEISVFAPAKINLFLDVKSKLPNGYHEIETLFAKIGIGDDIKISAQKADKTSIELKVRGPFGDKLKADKSNLVYKAAKSFFEYFNIQAQCNIRLEKNVPLGAGLGGGSSDAAAVIMSLCKIFNIETNAKRMKDLNAIAAKLGADVPFFLHDNTFSAATGIGDKLTPIKANIISPYIVVAWPGVPSSTKEAYERLGNIDGQKQLTNASSLNKIIRVIERGGPLKEWAPCVYNKLEDCVLPFLEPVAALKAEFVNLKAEGVLMSGSGSCVFALVQDKSMGERIVTEISKDKNRAVFLTHFWRTKYEDHGNQDSSNG